MLLSLEKLTSVADVLTGAEGNSTQVIMARIVWRCGVKGPIMLDIVGTHQLGRTCCLSYKSMKYQLKMESFKWITGSRTVS